MIEDNSKLNTKEIISKLYKEIRIEFSRCFLNQNSSHKEYVRKILHTYNNQSISEDDVLAPILFYSKRAMEVNIETNGDKTSNQQIDQPRIMTIQTDESEVMRIAKTLSRRESGKYFPKDGFIIQSEIIALIEIYQRMTPINPQLNIEEIKKKAKKLAGEYNKSKEERESRKNLNELYSSLAMRVEKLEEKFTKWEETK